MDVGFEQSIRRFGNTWPLFEQYFKHTNNLQGQGSASDRRNDVAAVVNFGTPYTATIEECCKSLTSAFGLFYSKVRLNFVEELDSIINTLGQAESLCKMRHSATNLRLR